MQKSVGHYLFYFQNIWKTSYMNLIVESEKLNCLTDKSLHIPTGKSGYNDTMFEFHFKNEII